jgi:hypothetical protein
MRMNAIKWTKLGKLPNFNIIISPNMKIMDNIELDKIIEFLNINFSSYLKLSNDNIKKYLLDSKSTNITLYELNNIIGFIHSRPINIIYNNNENELNYVEYLCVNKKYRGCNIAAIMIASLINNMNMKKEDNNRLYLFKKDGLEHKFLPFIRSKYFCLDLKNVNNTKKKIEYNIDISLDYNEWNNKANEYKFARIMNEEEWNDEMIIRKKYKIKMNNKIYVIIGQKSKIKEDNTNVFDIEYIYETKDNKNVLNYNEWLEYLRECDFEYITVNDIADYMNILSVIGEWKSGNEFQYYLYNGVCPLIDKSDIYFTIN